MPQPKKSPASGRSTTKRGAASRSAKSAPAKRSAPRKRPPARPSVQDEEELRGHLTAMRDLLGRGVVLTGDRLQETLDEMVRRGRMTRGDAEELLQSLVSTGRRQTQDLVAELEALLERGRSTARRAPGTDLALQQVDRARRAAGVGSVFPITSYDDLTAAQITERLDALSPAELRKIRDHERRNANRKSVLGAVERKLG